MPESSMSERGAVPESSADLRGRARLTSVLNEQELLSVQKPAQYLGGELNSVVKNDADVDVHFALCFPDTYEVGMSHLGIQILYDVLNRDPKVWAERIYMPMADMEELLRKKSLPLRSLEARRPLSEFDVVGFSLQYELCGTNLLAMLELGGLALYAKDRRESDPLIIGGGPYSYHPEALAPFFDAFFLGDAEVGISDIVAEVRRLKRNGVHSRTALVEAVSNIEGVYVPSQFEPEYSEDGTFVGVKPLRPDRTVITRRLLPSMVGAPYPVKPVVPNIQTVHNRLAVEVMRGCVRGCRFCQAGYLYRPQRERSPEEIMKIVEEALPNTGFEELSLLSLSTADYCSVVPLLKALMDRYAADDKLSISFPSTRVDALTPEVLEQVQRVRRTNFTVAPEGGTQRLRDVINKGVTDEQILETCSNVFRMGWNGIKLYFMLGLPTETDEDLEGIISLAQRARALPEAKGKDITVSVSTLVPKPHTPFQWAAQISPDEVVRRQRLLADGLRRAKVNFRYHDSFSSFLEGIFCRAGREFAPVLVRAYELGCRLDAWQDHLKEDLWNQAFIDCNIDAGYYLRERSVEEPLPWDHLSCGIPKSYFLKEWQRALRDKATPDCLTTSCSICGACDYDVKRNVLWPRTETERMLAARPKREVSGEPRSEDPAYRIRLRYEKGGAQRFLGHLELVGIFHRAARRANVPLAFSRGFHPMPRLAFGPPLSLGTSSTTEFVDAFLTEKLPADALVRNLNEALPPGLLITEALWMPKSAPSIQDAITEHRFRATWLSEPGGIVGDELAKTRRHGKRSRKDLADALGDLTIERLAGKKKKGGKNGAESKSFRIADFVKNPILSLPVVDDELPQIEFSIAVDKSVATPKASEILKALSESGIGDYVLEKIDTTFIPLYAALHAD